MGALGRPLAYCLACLKPQALAANPEPRCASRGRKGLELARPSPTLAPSPAREVRASSMEDPPLLARPSLSSAVHTPLALPSLPECGRPRGFRQAGLAPRALPRKSPIAARRPVVIIILPVGGQSPIARRSKNTGLNARARGRRQGLHNAMEGDIEAVRREAREQSEIAASVSAMASGAMSAEDREDAIRKLVEAYEASSGRLREALWRRKTDLAVAEAVGLGKSVEEALGREVDACDGAILSLIREARAALDSINIVQQE